AATKETCVEDDFPPYRMEDCLYDTSWLIHSLPALTPSFLALLAPPSTQRERSQLTGDLSTHAGAFGESISQGRPRYESEEERERLGSLSQCKWNRLEGLAPEEGQTQPLNRKRMRDDGDDDSSTSHGILISLIYERTTYKFIIYTTPNTISSKRSRTETSNRASSNQESRTAILLSKSSPSLLRSLTTYLSDTFALPKIHPLQMPSALIQKTLQNYLSTIYSSLSTAPGSTQSQVQDLFINIISSVRLTIGFSAPVAPHLKSLDIAVAPYAVLKALPENGRFGIEHFMSTLAGYIWANTGLKIPVLDDRDNVVQSLKGQEADIAKSDAPMKISRISNAAYAISCDHRIKFVSRPLHSVDDPDQPDENCVRRANQELLVAIVEEARRQVREDS
ncbi:hypothetical protein PV05_03828, partial [Exophiala xenobiotica]